MRQYNIKKSTFFEEISMSSANFKGRNMLSEIGGDKIVKILSVYPNLSAEWLMRGEGEMLQEIENNKTNKEKPTLQAIDPPKQNEINNFYTSENLQKWLTFLIANLNKENEYNGYLPLFLKLNYIVMVFNRYLPETQFNKIYQSYLNTDDESTLLKQFPAVITNILETSEQLTSYETEINQIYNLTKEITKKVGIIRK